MLSTPDTDTAVKEPPKDTEYIVGAPERTFSSTPIDHLTTILTAIPDLDKNRKAQALHDLQAYQVRLQNQVHHIREEIARGRNSLNPSTHSVVDSLVRTGTIRNFMSYLGEYEPANPHIHPGGRRLIDNPSHPVSDLYDKGLALEAFGMLPADVTANNLQESLHKAEIVVCTNQDELDKARTAAETSHTITILEYRNDGEFVGRSAVGFRNDALGTSIQFAIKYDGKSKKPIPRTSDMRLYFDDFILYQIADQTPDTPQSFPAVPPIIQE